MLRYGDRLKLLACMWLANLLIQKLQLKFKSVTIALFMHRLAENKSDLWLVANKFGMKYSSRKAFVKAYPAQFFKGTHNMELCGSLTRKSIICGVTFCLKKKDCEG